LIHALAWAAAAWAVWLGAAGLAAAERDAAVARYLALCLTACAAVAVLGARRPGAWPWNFVVLGLLTVLSLPLAEHALTGQTLRPEGYHLLLIGGTLAVGVLNYLPTRFGPAAFVCGVGCGLELWALAAPADAPAAWGELLAALAPWVALAAPRRAAAAVDRAWLDFRDRFGLVWGQRLREQFNHAANHAGWPVVLAWRGLRPKRQAGTPGPGVDQAVRETLRALMKRFGSEGDSGSASAAG
jgi:hypothetical protein